MVLARKGIHIRKRIGSDIEQDSETIFRCIKLALQFICFTFKIICVYKQLIIIVRSNINYDISKLVAL